MFEIEWTKVKYPRKLTGWGPGLAGRQLDTSRIDGNNWVMEGTWPGSEDDYAVHTCSKVTYRYFPNLAKTRERESMVEQVFLVLNSQRILLVINQMVLPEHGIEDSVERIGRIVNSTPPRPGATSEELGKAMSIHEWWRIL